MSVGTTDTWAASRDNIIDDALANVGAIGPGGSADGAMRTHAARALDRVVKAIDANGEFLWRSTRLTFTTTAATATYTLNANVFAVNEPVSYLKSGGTVRVPLSPMSQNDFMVLPDRTTQATLPSRYYIEQTLSSGRTALTMTLYPVPSASSDTVEYVGALRSKDFNTGATNPDFPSAWHKCLVYGLTAELAAPYKQADLIAVYAPMFQGELDKQIGNDNEKQGVMFVPFGSY